MIIIRLYKIINNYKYFISWDIGYIIIIILNKLVLLSIFFYKYSSRLDKKHFITIWLRDIIIAGGGKMTGW